MKQTHTHLGMLGLLASLFGTIHCGTSSASPYKYAPTCDVGSEGCACTAGGTCDSNLECKANECVRSSGSGNGGATAAGGSSGEPPSAGSGGSATNQEKTCTAEEDDALLAKYASSSSLVPRGDDCQLTLGGTSIAVPREGYLRTGDPASVALTFADGTLTNVGTISCRPAAPGMVSTLYPGYCTQDYVCGCCVVHLRRDLGAWGIEPGGGSSGPSCPDAFPYFTEYYIGGYPLDRPSTGSSGQGTGGSSGSGTPSTKCGDCLDACAGSPFCGTAPGANCYDACYRAVPVTPNTPCDPMIQICN